MKLTLTLLLRDLGDAGERAALALGDLVVSPLLFLGSALLYVDQAGWSAGFEQQLEEALRGRRQRHVAA